MSYWPLKEVWVASELATDFSVSSYGRVMRRTRAPGTRPGRLIHTFPRKGYPSIKAKGKTLSVHHLVAHAFIGPRPLGLEVDHLDEDKTNNCFWNLAYTTHRKNTARSIRGSKHPRAVLDEKLVRAIRILSDEYGRTPTAIAEELGIRLKNVEAVLYHGAWRHV